MAHFHPAMSNNQKVIIFYPSYSFFRCDRIWVVLPLCLQIYNLYNISQYIIIYYMILYDTMWLNSPVPTWDASIRKGPVLSAAPGKLQSSRPRRDHFWCLKKQYTHTHTFRGFQKWGYLKHGWFMSWKTPSFEMDDDWGYPFQETPTFVAVLRKWWTSGLRDSIFIYIYIFRDTQMELPG